MVHRRLVLLEADTSLTINISQVEVTIKTRATTRTDITREAITKATVVTVKARADLIKDAEATIKTRVDTARTEEVTHRIDTGVARTDEVTRATIRIETNEEVTTDLEVKATSDQGSTQNKYHVLKITILIISVDRTYTQGCLR